IVYQILIIFLPLVTAPYVSRVLGTENIGLYSYSYSVASYFVLFAMLGINNYGNKLIASIKKDKNKLNQEFSNLFFLHIFGTVIVMIVYYFYIKHTKDNKLYALICFIYLVGALFDINWFFFGMEEFKITVSRNIIIKLLTTVSIFIFVRCKSDVWKYILIMAVGNVVSQSIVWLWLPKFIKFKKPTFKNIKTHILQLFILFIPVIAVSLYKIMDKIMLKHMVDSSAVGLYENAEKIINIPIGILTAVGVVMLPRSSALLSDNNENAVLNSIKITTKYVLIISYALAFGLMAVGPEFAPIFYGEDFSFSGKLIQGLAITIPFMASANIIRTQYLIPKGYNKIYILSVILGAIVNIILNSIFIPVFQSVGAVIGTVMAEIVVFFIQQISVRNELKLGKVYQTSISYAFIGILMCITLRFTASFFEVNAVILLIEIALGALIYILLSTIVLYFQKDHLLFGLLNKIKKHNSKLN
ncbi:MAG: flippase, partial [Crenarchaeota archaeon]|nr:flippase [Thermoproteota archaeon]